MVKQTHIISLKQRGAILPVVLWVVMICLVAAGSYAANVKLAVATVNNNLDAIKLKYAARSGLYIGLNRLLNQGGSYGELVPSSLSEMRLLLHEQNIHVTMREEQLKLGLNQATQQQISHYLAGRGVDQDRADVLAARIIDWRDANKLRSSQGMEDEDYRAAGYQFGAKDSFYNDMEELKLIPAMNQQVYQLLQAGFTLYPAAAGRVINLQASVINKQGITLYRINSMVQLTGHSAKPYRFLKWSQATGGMG